MEDPALDLSSGRQGEDIVDFMEQQSSEVTAATLCV